MPGPIWKSPTNFSTCDAAPKQPIRKLPPSIEVPANATVEEVKQLVARKAGIWDHNRVGLFSPTSKKTIKDRRAKISEEDGVVSAGELLVKDLGNVDPPFPFLPRRSSDSDRMPGDTSIGI